MMKIEKIHMIILLSSLINLILLQQNLITISNPNRLQTLPTKLDEGEGSELGE